MDTIGKTLKRTNSKVGEPEAPQPLHFSALGYIFSLVPFLGYGFCCRDFQDFAFWLAI